MIRLADKLKVHFYEGSKQITKDSKSENDPSMYIDLDTVKGSNVLKIIMESNIIELQGTKYKVVERQFLFDDSLLVIKMVKNGYVRL